IESWMLALPCLAMALAGSMPQIGWWFVAIGRRASAALGTMLTAVGILGLAAQTGRTAGLNGEDLLWMATYGGGVALLYVANAGGRPFQTLIYGALACWAGMVPIIQIILPFFFLGTSFTQVMNFLGLIPAALALVMPMLGCALAAHAARGVS